MSLSQKLDEIKHFSKSKEGPIEFRSTALSKFFAGYRGKAGHFLPSGGRQKSGKLGMFEEFHLSNGALFKLANEFKKAMINGLQQTDEHPRLPMLPTYVVVNSFHPRDGLYLGVDFGGTNFRMSLIQMQNGSHACVKKPLSIPIPNHVKAGTGHHLFEFIALQIQQYICEHEQANSSACISMGFTFSYPTRQTGPKEGFLIQWAKDIHCNDVVGMEIVAMLQQKLDLIKCPVRIDSLLNDTVAAIMAYKLAHPAITMSSIFGTGTNGAYIEHVSQIEKLTDCRQDKNKNEKMIINTEWGSFWTNELEVTEYDKRVDEKSLYPGSQRFEKMISGRYLNEIVIEYLHANANVLSFIPKSISMELITQVTDEFEESAICAKILSDRGTNLGAEEAGLARKQVGLFRELCLSVVERAARLGAVPIACCLQRTLSHTGNACVCVDGSLYEKNKLFQKVLQETVGMLVGRTVSFFNGTVEECSCLGAVVSAACQE